MQYFVAVAEELHFGRAAERLHIAQPSLSHQIRRLELQLGVRLLERTSRRVELTAAGRVLLEEGTRVLAESRRVLGVVRAAGADRVTVGFFGSAGTALLPRVLEVFSERHPNVPVSVRDLLLGRLDPLLTGDVDVAFTRLVPGQAALALEVIARESRVVALRTDHRLAGRQRVVFADLSGERFITNPVLGTDGPPARWLAEQARHGLAGTEAAQAASVQEILTLVASRRGVSLVPASVAAHFPRPDVSYVEVVDADPAVTSLAWPRGDVRPAVQAFIAAVRDVASIHTHSM